VSSVVVEANSQVSSQPARSKPGQGNPSTGGDRFSGLVDSNLAVRSDTEANSPAERPRGPARADSPDSQPRPRTGIQRKPGNQADSARQTPSEPSATDAPVANGDTTAKPDEALTIEAIIAGTGLVAATVSGEHVDAAPQTEAEIKDAPAPEAPAPVPGALVVAAAVTVQIGFATEVPAQSVIESGDAIVVSNPPATMVASPAETAANALARVAIDTGGTQPTVAAEAGTGNSSAVQTSSAPAETAPVSAPDVSATDAAPETPVEATPRIQTAAVEAQVSAKASTELSQAAKATDPSKPIEQPQPGRLASSTEIKPIDANGDGRIATPEQPSAKPESPRDRRVEADAGTQPDLDKSAEPETRPTLRPAHEPATSVSAQVQRAASEQPPPTGFGVSHTASPQVANATIAAAQLTALPAANVAVPIGGLAVEIAANVQIGRSRFDIRLDPPELGRIDVRLDVDRNGQVTSHLIVEKSATLDLLRRDASQLERALQDAGLKTSDNGLQFSLRDQQQQSNRNDDNGSQRNAQRLIVADEDTIAAETAGRSYGRMAGLRGGIDIRV
jgi:flagellar hook-length control protein FliK